MGVTRRNLFVIVLHVALFILLMAGYKFISEHAGRLAGDVAIGFALGTYVLFAKQLVDYVFAAIRHWQLPYFDSNKFIQWYMFFVVLLLIGVGVFAWYASWQGRTTWCTGVGVFVAMLLFDLGVAHLFDGGQPFGKKA